MWNVTIAHPWSIFWDFPVLLDLTKLDPILKYSISVWIAQYFMRTEGGCGCYFTGDLQT